jgi:predicted Rossmann fold flavoprotein
MAAASSASRGKSTLLLEKNRKLGVKILMSGGTRCNITHDCPTRDFTKAFGRNGRFLHSALAALPPSAVLSRLHGEGVHTKVESTGKIFPSSNKAIDVRDALVRLARKSGAEIHNEAAVLECTKVDEGFEVKTENQTYSFESLLITSGGRSYPGCGTTGDGYAWAKSFGHSITPLGAALTPVVAQVPWANELKGISVENVNASIFGEAKKPLHTSDRPVLFTHFGFSGPGPMNVSRAISLSENKKLKLAIDFYPDQNSEQLFDLIQRQAKSTPAGSLLQTLTDDWPRRLKESLLKSIEFDPAAKAAEVSKKQLRRLAEYLKRVSFPVNGTRGYAKAEVTAGGVDLREVNSSTMQSKLVDGLFFAGEILDLDGPIGGFNFQSAFSTGWLAGQNV